MLSFAFARRRFLDKGGSLFCVCGAFKSNDCCVPSANYLRHEKIEVDLCVRDRPRNSMPQPRPVITFHQKGRDPIGVFLTDTDAKFTYPDGRSEDINAKAGSVQHMDAFTHLPESTSKEPFEVILVELKG
jgi:hypothetical protein